MIIYQNCEFTDVCRESESGPGIRQGGAALYDALWSVFLGFLALFYFYIMA